MPTNEEKHKLAAEWNKILNDMFSAFGYTKEINISYEFLVSEFGFPHISNPEPWDISDAKAYMVDISSKPPKKGEQNGNE